MSLPKTNPRCELCRAKPWTVIKMMPESEGMKLCRDCWMQLRKVDAVVASKAEGSR